MPKARPRPTRFHFHADVGIPPDLIWGLDRARFEDCLDETSARRVGGAETAAWRPALQASTPGVSRDQEWLGKVESSVMFIGDKGH